jgi:hypothetical protein
LEKHIDVERLNQVKGDEIFAVTFYDYATHFVFQP